MRLSRKVPAVLAILALAAGIGAAPAAAQLSPLPGPKGPPQAATAQPPPKGGNVPGQFDYYSLVLSWSPSYCAGLERDRYDPQCHRRDGKRYAFVLHGLWPQHERGWPESCPTRERPFVPQSIIDRMQDIMPSPGLTIHEYRKHGTCSGLDPAGYYDLSRKLFAKVKIPQRFVDPPQPFMIGPGEVVNEFVAANLGLKPENFAVACGGPGNRLKELRFCFTREGEFRACGRNEDPRRLCSAQRMFVPPVRTAPAQPAAPKAPGERRL
jgi:ribonuclease T2